MTDFSPYVGLPYAKDGRGPDLFDCLGLCQLVFRNELGLDIPDHPAAFEPHDDGRDRLIVFADASGWQQIPVGLERPFDLVLMRDDGWHIGLVTGFGEMLHIRANRESVIEAFNTMRHRSRVEGVYRHPARIVQ